MINKEITSYFQATRPIRYRWYVIKRWVRESLCKHNYQLKIVYRSISIARLPVWGNGVDDVIVGCPKCGKEIIREKPPLWKINWDMTRDCKKLDPRNIPEKIIINGRTIKTGINIPHSNTKYKPEPSAKTLRKRERRKGKNENQPQGKT